MIYELRTYTLLPGNRQRCLEFMEKMSPVRERLGMRLIGAWTTAIGREEEFVFMLAHESLDAREEKWAKWREDPEARKLEKELAQGGPLSQYHDVVILRPTPFSPLK